MDDIARSFSHNSSKMGNLNSSSSMDPLLCYNGMDRTICIRIGVLVALISLTAALLIARVIQYHCYRNRHYLQYFVLYTGIFITFLLFLHAMYFSQVQFDFASIFLVLIQVNYPCYDNYQITNCIAFDIYILFSL
jgi:hypothetical protein